jgi:DNA-binding SARP family transcriptional activator
MSIDALEPAMQATPVLRLQLLGEPMLLREAGGAITQPWRPHVALLALLALAPGGVLSRTALTSMLWPDTSERQARASLRQALFRLRRDVGPLILAAGDTLQLDGSRLAVDVREFEQLLDTGDVAAAVASYHGPFLAGFGLRGNVDFDHWADGERARLEARVAAAYTALVEGAAASGDWAVAMRCAEQWLAIEPCSETAAARLMALRAQSGDAAAALAFCERFRAHLWQELGVEPGGAFEALADRIRRVRVPAPPDCPTPGGRGAPTPVRPPMPLIGRQSEFARLEAYWQRTLATSSQFVLLTGEAGIGKTRLAREFASWVQLRGGSALYGRAYQVEQDVPYAALTGALRAALDAPGLTDVDVASLCEISRVLPEVRARFGSDVVPVEGDLETGRLRLLEAVRALLLALARQAPVLLVVDDLPWSDEATLSALHYLHRRLVDARVLWLGTARDADMSACPAIQRLLAADHDSPEHTVRLSLAPLEPDQIGRFAAAFDDTYGANSVEAVPGMLERESGGNPLFLLEVLRARHDGSGAPADRRTIRDVVAELTTGLLPEGRQLLHAAAILGRAFPLPLASAVAALPHTKAIIAIEQLLERRLLHRIDYEYDFVHDLLRGTVYAGLSPERRQLLHRLAFERLAPSAGEVVGLERASALATHAEQGGLPEEAREWLLRAAELAVAVFGGQEAERFLERATAFAATPSELHPVLEKLGDLRRVQARFDEAAVTYHAAVGHTAPHTATRLRLRIKLFEAATRAGAVSLPDGEPAIDSLLEDAAAAGSAWHRDALMAAAGAWLRADDVRRAEAHTLSAVAAARTAGEAGPLVRALLLRAQCGVLCRSLHDPLAVLDEALQIARQNRLGRELCDVETEVATELCRQGRWQEAIAGWERALRHGESIGAIGAVAIAHLNLADVHLRRGEWNLADEHLAHAEALAGRYHFPHALAAVLVNRALAAWYRGDPPRVVIAAARRALDTAVALALPAAEHVARSIMALAHLAGGDVEAARAALDAATPPVALTHPTWADDRELGVAARARLAAAQDRYVEARAILASALDEAREPWSAGFLMLELATLDRVGDPAAADRLAREAAEVLGPLGAAPLLARATGWPRETRTGAEHSDEKLTVLVRKPGPD